MKRNVFDLFYKMKWWAWKNDICGYNNSSIKTIFLKKRKRRKKKKGEDILITKEINGIVSVKIIVNFHLLYEIVIRVIKN